MNQLARITPPRTLATILAELTDARRDLDQAMNDIRNRVGSFFDAEDRCAEAEQRQDALREEFAALFSSLTGMTLPELVSAHVECVI